MQQSLLTLETLLVLCIVAAAIFFQAKAFKQNRKRMNDFCSIFSKENTWSVCQDKNNTVTAIAGHGNSVFLNITKAINNLLANPHGPLIDLAMLKDAVDRNCNTARDEINAQMPVPIYYGLAGTMGGVIVSLFFMSGTSGTGGILTSLALVASAAGIVMTTLNTQYFKEKKTIQEKGKNNFIDWMQANLPTRQTAEPGQAMQDMATSLNRLNTTLATNNAQLQATLAQIALLCQDQSQALKLLHDSDIQKTATANTEALHQLNDCTSRLQQLNDYLNAVKGYAAEISNFRQQLSQEQERLYVLEEIRDFFRNHGYKEALAKTITDSDDSLRTALRNLQQATSGNMDTMSHTLTQQTETFRQVAQEMQETFEKQLQHFPQLQEQIQQIAQIPGQLEKLAKDIESSNTRMANSINYALQNIRVEFPANPHGNASHLPAWLPLLLAVIALFAAMPYIVKAFETLKEAF